MVGNRRALSSVHDAWGENLGMDSVVQRNQPIYGAMPHRGDDSNVWDEEDLQKEIVRVIMSPVDDEIVPASVAKDVGRAERMRSKVGKISGLHIKDLNRTKSIAISEDTPYRMWYPSENPKRLVCDEVKPFETPIRNGESVKWKEILGDPEVIYELRMRKQRLVPDIVLAPTIRRRLVHHIRKNKIYGDGSYQVFYPDMNYTKESSALRDVLMSMFSDRQLSSKLEVAIPGSPHALFPRAFIVGDKAWNSVKDGRMTYRVMWLKYSFKYTGIVILKNPRDCQFAKEVLFYHGYLVHLKNSDNANTVKLLSENLPWQWKLLDDDKNGECETTSSVGEAELTFEDTECGLRMFHTLVDMQQGLEIWIGTDDPPQRIFVKPIYCVSLNITKEVRVACDKFIRHVEEVATRLLSLFHGVYIDCSDAKNGRLLYGIIERHDGRDCRGTDARLLRVGAGSKFRPRIALIKLRLCILPEFGS
uniref:Transposon protein, putative, CACTA, En/Spm sub-class n=1 Tax=Angiostrongylus cantonensis TaxID=6313 RepID=A0A0K0DMQ8_ANGCA